MLLCSSSVNHESLEESCADRVFRLLLAFFGLHAGKTPPRWFQILSSIFLLIVLPCFFLDGPLFLYARIASQKTTRPSLSEITALSSVISYSVCSCYVVLLLKLKRGEIEPLLQRNQRTFFDVLPFLLLMLPEFVANVSGVVNDGRILMVIVTVTLMLQYFSMVIFFMVYQDITASLTRDLAGLRLAMTVSTTKLDDLIADRWEIRDKIHTTNALFALPLSLFYLQIFSTTVYVAAEVILQSFGYCLESILSLSYSCFLLKVSILAHRSSNVRIASRDIERELLEKSRKIATIGSIDPIAARTFEFRNEWDSLRVGCFDHTLPNFWRFISVLTTCVAVVLQFDYRVVRMIADLADLSNNETKTC